MHPAAVYSFEELLEKEPQVTTQADGVLLTVKQTSITEALAGWIGRRLGAGVPLVCYQNGIGHTDLLARYVPVSSLLAAVTTEGALRHSMRHVEHTGRGTTWIGQLESENVDETSILFQKKLQNQLKQAGFDVSLSNQITSKVWNKLLINAVINPLTAVLQVSNGTLPELPAALPLMRSLYEEGSSLAEALGIPLAPDLWEQLLAVCRLTANNRSSMLQDVQSRRRTELDAITGGLLKKADEAGMQLHAHRTVYALVRSIEQQWQ
ncbi:ketopantoate reductase family protein [Paenibacillus sp. TAB 01]|uniref:ketopantoate reductase family protein n=1 Tax=Paenibacillus sp. TAB 01 TaxID=3368988 RepID=UPI003750A5C0